MSNTTATATPMFGGSNSTITTARVTYTGLNVFQVMGVNPSKEQIEEWTGTEYKLNVDYTIREVNGRRVRPIEVWVQSIDEYVKPTPVRFLVGLDDAVNDNGTARYVNVVGDFCQGKTDPSSNEKMAWFTKHPYRVAKQGEYELYSFMQALMLYNSRAEGSQFMKDAENANITASSLFDNELDGLINFFNWTKTNDNKIVLLCAVKKSEKVNGETGEARTYYNQTIIVNPDYFFRTSTNQVSSRSHAKLLEALESGRRVSNSLFTVHFQEFKEEDCVNNVPAETVVPASAPTQSFGQWAKN